MFVFNFKNIEINFDFILWIFLVNYFICLSLPNQYQILKNYKGG